MKNKEILKKKIIYRSLHRGTKEMDLLIGTFVKKNINILNDKELLDLNFLVETDDEVLKGFFFGKNSENLIPINKVFKMFKKFRI